MPDRHYRRTRRRPAPAAQIAEEVGKVVPEVVTYEDNVKMPDVFALAHRLGIDPPKFQDLIAVSSGSSAILRRGLGGAGAVVDLANKLAQRANAL